MMNHQLLSAYVALRACAVVTTNRSAKSAARG